MNTQNQIVCVLRSVNGTHQWVAASGRQDLVNNEATMVGFFDEFQEKSGPSASHIINCYEPHRSAQKSLLDISEFQVSSGALSADTQKSCVLRVVGDYLEYVDANGRQDLLAGETLVSGMAVRATVNTGPSNSHAVSIWNFVGATKRSVVPQNDEIGVYSLAELLQVDPRTVFIDYSKVFMDDELPGVRFVHPESYIAAAAQ